MVERDIWNACRDFICRGGSQAGFQRWWGKYELHKIYPYLLSWEIYAFLKYGYEGLHICKNCGEQITKLHETEFCSKRCRGEYLTKQYAENPKLLWSDAKKLCCEHKERGTLKNVIREANPLTIISNLYAIEPRHIFEYLISGIDPHDIKPVQKPYVYKSWEELMGFEKAQERKAKMIARQTGGKHSEEWVENMRAWYRNEENMEKFKRVAPQYNYSPEIRDKQSATMKTKILNGEFTPQSNYNRYRSKGVLFDGIHFRSRYEVIFYAYHKYISGNSIEFERVRIPYYDHKSCKNRVYITDFYNSTLNEIVEIKPQSCLIKELKDKLVGVACYLKENDVRYKVLTEKNLQAYLKQLINLPELQNDKTFQSIFKVYKSWI